MSTSTNDLPRWHGSRLQQFFRSTDALCKGAIAATYPTGRDTALDRIRAHHLSVLGAPESILEINDSIGLMHSCYKANLFQEIDEFCTEIDVFGWRLAQLDRARQIIRNLTDAIRNSASETLLTSLINVDRVLLTMGQQDDHDVLIPR
jgi:hypothetical protein